MSKRWRLNIECWCFGERLTREELLALCRNAVIGRENELSDSGLGLHGSIVIIARHSKYGLALAI